MKKMLRSAAALLHSGCMMVATALAATTSFSDVPSSHWGYTFVTRAASEGLVSGMGNGKFGVDDQLSNAQFTTMICNLFYKTEVDAYQNTYKPSEWWRSYMAVAYTKGLLNNTVVGTSRATNNSWLTADVNAKISRYDMAQIMVNVSTAQGWQGVTTQEVTSVQAKIADWSKVPAKYQTAVATAYAKGYLSGMDAAGTFAGDQSMTRTHGAVVVCKLMDAKSAASSSNTGTTEAPTFTNTTNLVNGKAPTKSNVLSAVADLKKEFPTGYIWSTSKSYRSPVLGNATGGDAFILMLGDQIFGNLELDTSDLEDVKAGDIIHLSDSRTYVLVEKVSGDEISYVSCNSSGRVTWGNKVDMDDLDNWDTVYTRYDADAEDEDEVVSTDGKLSNGKDITTANVKALIEKFLNDKYEDGDEWDEDDSYKAPAFSTRHVYGNEAFAYYFSDYIFDDLKVYDVEDFDDLRVGDVIYYAAWNEYLGITKIDGDTIYYIGVYQDEVYEDDFDVDDLGSSDFAYTRYPDAEEKELLSNGKAVTAANVKALIADFLDEEYDIGDFWDEDDSYKSTDFTSSRVYADQAFAYYLSDYIFDNLDVHEVNDFDDLRVGDVIYHAGWKEYLVVTSISGDTIEYIGVYDEVIYSDKLDVDDLDSSDSAYSRYPEEIKKDTLSDGKSATSRNVMSLISKFTSDSKYKIGAAWAETEKYKATAFSSRYVYADQAYAYRLSDYIFGSLDVYDVEDFGDLRVGDVLYYDDWDEYLTITKISGDELSVLGVYGEKVYEDELDVDDLDSNDFAYSRYPDKPAG